MVVDQIRAATQDLLAALTPEQLEKISAPFDTPDHKSWTYLPGAVPGLPLTELSAAQEALVMRLLELVYSERGLADFRGVLVSEIIVRGLADPLEVAEVGGWAGSTVGDRYYLRVLGDPGGAEPWAWRLNGHHLALHVALVDGAIAFTPQFFGSNPAEVRTGPHAGRRFLIGEQDLGFQFSLLIGQYVGRAAGPIGLQTWQDITDHGIERLTFAWAGDTQPGAGHPHYYSIAGPTFLAEYDNTQDDANHIHSVWRDLRNDWGTDLLAAHYAMHR